MLTPTRDKRKAAKRPQRDVETRSQSGILSLSDPRGDEEPASVVHIGIVCSGTNCPNSHAFIQGVRYACPTCGNRNFCSSCHQQPDNGHDPAHTLIECVGPSEVIYAVPGPDGQLVGDDGRPIDTRGETILINSRALNNDLPDLSHRLRPDFHSTGTSKDSSSNEKHVRKDSKFPETADGAVTRQQEQAWKQLNTEVFGENNAIDDELLVHWKNGVPAVRLIDLFPGTTEEPLACLFTSTRLDRTETYEVVCVAWHLREVTDGSSASSMVEMPSVICVGEEYREISKATADALKSVRSTCDVKKVWIEELCVHRERAEFAAFQERSTSLIFSKADCTIVWTGDSDSDTETTFALMEMLSHRCNNEDGILPFPTDFDGDSDLENLDFLPVGSEKWIALAKFFPPHLFVQGWMLHDVAFASNKAVVKCGEYQLDWWQVAKVRDMLAQPSWMSLDWRQPWHTFIV
jgi:hypothetical protein